MPNAFPPRKLLRWRDMVVRITKTNSVERTVLKVDGLLQAADVDSLNQEWAMPGKT